MRFFKKKYPALSFQENFLGSHFSIGNLTVHGENAMHYGCHYHTKRWGYVCFRLPLPCFGRWWPLYFYVSPNATPWAATFYIGDSFERAKAILRRKYLGHNFSYDSESNCENYQLLQKINRF